MSHGLTRGRSATGEDAGMTEVINHSYSHGCQADCSLEMEQVRPAHLVGRAQQKNIQLGRQSVVPQYKVTSRRVAVGPELTVLGTGSSLLGFLTLKGHGELNILSAEHEARQSVATGKDRS